MPASSQRSSRKKSANAAVLVVSGSAKYRPYERVIRRALTVGLQTLRVRGSLEVYLVDDRTMRHLNKRYRGKDKSTNVLSFPWPRHFVAWNAAGRGWDASAAGVHVLRVQERHREAVNAASRPLGEIYLGPDHISRQKEDIVFMAVHGLLHLAGYDHERAGDRARMERKERVVMRAQSVSRRSEF